MSKTPVFIVNYNRLGYPRSMCEYLAQPKTGCEPIIIDNNSDYPPLIEWYEECPYTVERMHINYGNCVLWTSNILDKYGFDGNYILSDSDLDISDIPLDFLEVLRNGLDMYQWADKCGFSLKIDDLPCTEVGNTARGWEMGNWSNKLKGGYYKAPIDTTFAIYRTRIHSFDCIRTDIPYMAKHLPWYHTKDNIPDDERYYINSINSDFNYYSRLLKNEIN